MQNLEFIIPIAFFWMVAMIVKIVTDNRTRQKLIDKGLVDEKVKYLYARDLRENPLQSLKWGIVLVGIGIALAIGQIFPMMEGPALMGLMFIFAGIAFVIYYILAKRQTPQE